MNKMAVVGLVCVVLSGAVLAAPSPEIQYLANEPASMLDLGLLRLRYSIQSLLNYNQRDLGLKSRVGVTTTYNFARDQIQVILIVPENVSSPKETCRRIVTAIQTWMNSTTVWREGFTHAGYTSNQREDTRIKVKLPGLIVIDGNVIGDPRNARSALASIAFCSATLSRPGVTFAAH